MNTDLIPAPAQSAEFLAIYNRLCVGLREAPDDSGITQGIYWDALKDLPCAALETGAVALMREPGRRFFPTTAEWRQAAERAQITQLREAVRPARDAPWVHECHDCEDTGWRYHTCTETNPCLRTKAHARPHDYVTPCPCRVSNRTYMRHQNFGAGA